MLRHGSSCSILAKRAWRTSQSFYSRIYTTARIWNPFKQVSADLWINCHAEFSVGSWTCRAHWTVPSLSFTPLLSNRFRLVLEQKIRKVQEHYGLGDRSFVEVKNMQLERSAVFWSSISGAGSYSCMFCTCTCKKHSSKLLLCSLFDIGRHNLPFEKFFIGVG